MIALHGQHVIVPFGRLDDKFVLGRWPYDPAAARRIDAAGVVIEVAVDFELVSLGHVGGSGLEAGAVEDAAIAAGDALEADGQLKILVMLLGHQVPVALGDARAMNSAIFHGPILIAHLHPPCKVFAVEQGNPPFLGLFQARLSGRGRGEYYRQNQAAHHHAPISSRIAAAIRLVNSSTRARSGPSTITRASGSVPENRTSTRPDAPKAFWHASISRATAASSCSSRRSRTRTFCNL